ncbi:hypothetical protein HHK36_026599 [Tetracentron sinense]|uniref:F-box domain-containing protein n=1 Tax=Tetracentron sinense TaxID=13715 RepID=A0A834YLN1_TETSI|nr:hypothetical protein HHK36_026599 [Tetracentron sinense]
MNKETRELFEINSLTRSRRIKSKWRLMGRSTRSISKFARVKEGKQPPRKRQTMEDQISYLPDQILIFILSLLTMKDAARTSILSSRWRDFFKSFVESRSTLNFDVANMNGSDYLVGKFRNEDRELLLKQERDKYILWVDQNFHLHQRKKVDAVRLQFYLGEASNRHLDRWISYALDKGVQKLDVDLFTLDFSLANEYRYKFPCHLFAQGIGSCLKNLRLKACILSLPPDMSGFNSLVTLALEDLRLAQDQVDTLLSNCSLLEWLTLKNCHCPATLNIKVSFLQLKHLNITACYQVKRIEICASSLASFEYNGSRRPISFKNVPQLVRLFIGIHPPKKSDAIIYVVQEIVCQLPQLEILYLQMDMEENMLLPDNLPTFTNLKQLVLMPKGSNKSNFLGFISLLKVFPFLQKIELHYWCLTRRGRPREMQKEASKCPHSHLKEVNFYGFGGYPNEIEFALYLLKNATAIETMKINPNFSHYRGNNKWVANHEMAFGWTDKTRRESAYKLLCREVPHGAQLVVL